MSTGVALSLTGKLILGFLFALLLQITQIVVTSSFTARLQEAATQVAQALSASIALQGGLEAIAGLRSRIELDARRSQPVKVPVLRVFVEEAGAQLRGLAEAHPPIQGLDLRALDEKQAGLVKQLEHVERESEGAGMEPLVDLLAFLDDSAQQLEQELRQAQIALRAAGEAGVRRERAVRDLPLKASLLIAGAGILVMAAFVAWFSRQLVIPIERAWAELEERVATRTQELGHTVEELERQIQERRRAEIQKDELHLKLVDASRRAGMADLATGVLHNVGNVLNSVNVSANLLRQQLADSHANRLGRVAALLQDHAGELGEFLSSSQQGLLLPGYIEQLAAQLAQEKQRAVEEVGNLSARIDHLKEIVDRQQNYARSAAVTVQVDVSKLVAEALDMQKEALHDAHVSTEIAVDGDEHCEVDHSRVMQVLMNLVANARHSIVDTGRAEGRIAIRITRLADSVRIAVTDDGVGIRTADLERIFSHGFTTRRDGHGFGLHHSAIAAAQMGGRLWAESAGPGQGATFTLELPSRSLCEATP
ncbi:MAG: hypothetical protein IT457_25000 [Planctomycetes bacterium]|nr:hypothetical protein [Planctomycetota bacterium]